MRAARGDRDRGSNGVAAAARPVGRWSRRLGFVLIVLVVAAGGAEILLRLVPTLLPEDAAIRLFWRALDDGGGLKVVANEDLGYSMPASVEDQIAAGRIAFGYRTDPHGFRNPSPWPDEADVVVLGDSLAFGFGVDDEQGWVAQLDRQLPEHEVVNLGILAAAPQQYLMAYEAYGAPLEPEIILVALYPPNALGAVGDFDDWVAAGKPQRFDRWRARHFDSTPLDRIKRAVLRSHLVAGLYFADRDGHTVSFADGGRVRLAAAEVAGVAPEAGPGHARFERIIELLVRLQRLGDADGAELLVVLFPSKWEALEPLLGRPAPALVEPFARRLAELGIAHYDLTPVLRERSASGERLFFEVDIHPNPAGYQLIGEVVAEHLVQHALD
jgi:SGNH hydrolase-like domain, acetyltransferase AlgX